MFFNHSVNDDVEFDFVNTGRMDNGIVRIGN